MGFLVALLSTVFSSAKDLVSKRLAFRLDGTVSTFASFFCALPFYIVVLSVLYLVGVETLTWSHLFLLLVLLRSLTDTLAEWLKMHAFTYGDISVVATFFSLSPLFLLVVSPLLTGDPLTLSDVLAVLLVVGGSLLVVYQPSSTCWAEQKKGILLAIGAAAFFSLNSCFDRLAVQKGTPVSSGFTMTLLSAFFLAPFVIFRRERVQALRVHRTGLLIRGGLEVAFMVCKLSALQFLAAPDVVAVQRLSLLLSIIGGRVFFKEKHFTRRLTAGLLIVAGVVVIAWVQRGNVPALGLAATPPSEASRYFAIHVVDEQAGRGVPMVELQTTSSVRYYTDSAGLVAFFEPGLMNKKVWFGVAAHGYEFPADGFGNRGVTLQTQPGGTAQVKIKRLNIAERLYRITGQGIYRDTVLLGRNPPVTEPLLNADVTGQDGVLNAIYRGKLYWFYGDTNRLSYALGNFAMTGATIELPQRIDPSVGFQLQYFTGPDGFARPMVRIGGEGVIWLFGLVVIPDKSGRERMLAYFQRRRGLGPILENGFVVYADDKEAFEKYKDVPLDPPIIPQGYPFRVHDKDGIEYLYFTAPYPAVRVKADWKSYHDLASYEGYTCLKAGTRYGGKDHVMLDRDAHGTLVWGWKKDTPPLNPKDQEELIAAGKLKRVESPFRLQDADTGRPILLNNCSCFWNRYRKRYVMIASQSFGATMLGEVWYSEADRPEGPWVQARKIITHANKKGDAHDFYNPTQHPFFDQEGGRVIYLEGSYVNTFSGNPQPTPYYEYNQIMYRLDLGDPRLKLSPAAP